VTDKFEFIDAEYAAFRESNDIHVPSVVKMCRWMEVSRSGFYEWRGAPESATAKRREDLGLIITKSFDDSNETYGYRRVHADLVAWGVPAGPELVRSIMRELGLEPCQPRPWRFSLTEGDGQEHDIPDHVNRNFTADAPGEKMVGDITYIATWQGWLYLATVIDCHTKELVGWAMDDNYRTPLIQKAIEMAARNHQLAGKAIFHSDRGSNYTSHEFAKTLKKLDLRQSVGRTGICYDNALAESFNAALKNELVHRTHYPTRDHARRDIARYIEFWYNSRRRHSALQYRTPQQVRNDYLEHQLTALINRKYAVRNVRGRSFITTATRPSDGTTPMADIDWDAAITALHAGELPCSGSERRILLLAASLAGGIPVDLRDTVTGIDDANISRLLTAIRHAAGKRP
jgi:putative transposase